MSKSPETPAPQHGKTGEHAPIPSQDSVASDDGDGDPDAFPVPARYRWLRRTVLVAVAWPLIMFGLHSWWGSKAESALQSEIDRIVAAGEPIYPADFNPKERLPDDENAALVYIDAAAALTPKATDRDYVKKLARDAETVSAELGGLRTLVGKNQEALRLIRQANALTRADWGVRMRTPMFSALLPNLSGQRSLSRFVLSASLLRWREGDSQEAFALLEDALALARTVEYCSSMWSRGRGFKYQVDDAMQETAPVTNRCHTGSGRDLTASGCCVSSGA